MDMTGPYLSNVPKDSPQPIRRRRYDAAFRAKASRLARESRYTQVAARTLNSSPKLLCKWQQEALTLVAAARGAEHVIAAMPE